MFYKSRFYKWLAENKISFKTSAFRGNIAVIALLSALLLATVYNLAFWRQILNLPDISVIGNAGFLIGTNIVLTGIFFAAFTLCSYPYLYKTVIIFSFFLASTISYFSLKYGIVVDYNMISNVLETNIREASELFTSSFAFHLLLFAGLPYFVAPDEQKHIAAIAWLSESAARNHHINITTLLKGRDQTISHDNIFHSLLGIFDVKSKIYDPNLDLFKANYNFMNSS